MYICEACTSAAQIFMLFEALDCGRARGKSRLNLLVDVQSRSSVGVVLNTYVDVWP